MLAGFCSAPLALQPLITDDTGTQGSGGNQIELAVSSSRLTSLAETETTWNHSVVYTRGITEALDLYAGASFVRVHPAPSGGAPSRAPLRPPPPGAGFFHLAPTHGVST